MSDDDPFEELEEDVGEREGDPFDRLGHPPEEGADDPSPEEGADDPSSEEGPEESPTERDADEFFSGVAADEGTARGPGDTRGVSAQEGGADSGPAFDPTDDLEAPEFDRVEGRGGDPFESVGDAFTEMDVEGVDADEVWEKLSTSEHQESVSQQQGRTYAEVSKHSYCEQCEYFSEPPAIDCSHEGTEIVEFLDMETVRVVDCPVVAERKELQDEG